tara:strand:- start:237 stop:509 length:273 start_codon:yes stop_codon:yes gene_type:complete
MKTFIVYGITDCPACLRACADLMERDLEYVFVKTDFARSYRQQVKERYSHPTLPIITVITGASPRTEWVIGGYDSLIDYLVKGCNTEKAI